MSHRTNRSILVDSGFWFAIFDERDPYHRRAVEFADYIPEHQVVLPWPILYETLCTRFVRRPVGVKRFEILLKRPNIVFLEDDVYKQQALEMTLSGVGRPYSIVDNVLRLVMDDVNVRINYLFSFNRADFADICARRRIEILPPD